MKYIDKITAELVNGQKNSLLRMFTESLKTDPLTKCRLLLEYMEKTPDLSLDTIREGLDTVFTMLNEAEFSMDYAPVESMTVICLLEKVSVRINGSAIR